MAAADAEACPAGAHGFYEPGTPSACCFKERQLLTFPGIQPGIRYSLPFFLHDSLGRFLFCDEQGSPLSYCEDTTYRAEGHRLLWLEYIVEPSDDRSKKDRGSASVCRRGVDVDARMYFYFDPSAGPKGSGPLLRPPHVPTRVHMICEYFVKERRQSWPQDWSLGAGHRSAVTFMPCLDAWVPYSAPAPPWAIGTGRCLKLSKFAVLGRRLHLPTELSLGTTRLYLRVHFYDSEDAAIGGQWIGISSRFGSGAVGVAPGGGARYSFCHGPCTGSSWTEGRVPRSSGWHLFELTWEDEGLAILVDGVRVSRAKSEGHVCTESAAALQRSISREASDGPPPPLPLCRSESGLVKEEVFIVAEPDCVEAAWHGVEVFHTPPARGFWEIGVQNVAPGNRRPWRVRLLEEGAWHVCDGVVLAAHPDPEPERLKARAPPPKEDVPVAEAEGTDDEEEEEEEDAVMPEAQGEEEEEDQEVEEKEEDVPPEQEHEAEAESAKRPTRKARAKPPPKRPARPASRPRSQAGGRSALSGSAGRDFVVECWTLPEAETDVERMDRVVGQILASLAQAGVPLPDNIEKVNPCTDAQHTKCFVYNFGTRRLHLSTRAAEGGRLLLVVRIGGGFIDFVDFALKHGKLEQLKFERRKDGSGVERIQLTSVLTNRDRTVREMKA